VTLSKQFRHPVRRMQAFSAPHLWANLPRHTGWKVSAARVTERFARSSATSSRQCPPDGSGACLAKFRQSGQMLSTLFTTRNRLF